MVKHFTSKHPGDRARSGRNDPGVRQRRGSLPPRHPHRHLQRLELEGKALEEFLERRRKLNRYFASLGYDISAMLKPWSFGPFGRDMQAVGENKVNRNRARPTPSPHSLLWSRPQPCHFSPGERRHDVIAGAPALPPRPTETKSEIPLTPAGAKLWSKAGDTSEVRHDAATSSSRAAGSSSSCSSLAARRMTRRCSQVSASGCSPSWITVNSYLLIVNGFLGRCCSPSWAR